MSKLGLKNSCFFALLKPAVFHFEESLLNTLFSEGFVISEGFIIINWGTM
jgi:hypothetical protein